MKTIVFIYLFLSLSFIFSQETEKATFEDIGDYNASPRLGKYKSINVDSSEIVIIFDSSDFKEGEEMHFKLKAEEQYFYVDSKYNGIYYEYIGGDVPYDEDKLNFVRFQGKIETENTPSKTFKTKYFTITKKSSEFRGTNGNNLLIYFLIGGGDVEITNTKEDEGKIETWIIVVIVVAVVLVIGIAVGCWCWRRKKQLAAQNATTAGYAQAPGYAQNPNYAQPPGYAQAPYGQNAQFYQDPQQAANYGPGYQQQYS
jgi:hypothetical protein